MRTLREEMLDDGLSEEYYSALPARMLPALRGYVLNGRETGAFLTAVITNNLHAAFAQADPENLACLSVWTRFFHQWTPDDCWGSTSKMASWMQELTCDAE